VQGADTSARSGDKVAIIRHPDVRRMLMLMKSRTEAMRAIACVVALSMDLARDHPDTPSREQHQAFVDLMIPVIKGWSTESAVEIASLGVQVHGGMGFIEETGAAQHLRDARITPIYEGTTGIQAADLMGRKIARDGGQAMRAAIDQMRDVASRLARQDDEALASIGAALDDGIGALERAVQFVVSTYGRDARTSLVGSVPLLELLGIVAGGWQMGRAALAAKQRLAEGSDTAFHAAKLHTALFYAHHVLSRASGLSHSVVHGAHGALAIEDEQI
jgi:hypothetical protein